MYSERGLEVYLRQAHNRPAMAIVVGLVDDVGSFIQDTPQTDDLTALAVRYAGTA
jgi:hypothetical protein